MKKSFLLFALGWFLSLSIQAEAVVAVVQSVSAFATGASITTGNLTTTSGHLFICDYSLYGGATTSTVVSDSKANSYTDVFGLLSSAYDAAFNGGQHYKENGTGGATHNFTLTLVPGGFGGSIACKEVSGAVTSGALDKTSNFNNSNTLTSGLTSNPTATTIQANELLAGGAIASGAGTTTFTAQSGFTENQEIADVSGSTIGLVSASRVVTAVGSYAFTYDLSAAPDPEGSVGWVSTWKELTGAPIVVRRRIISGE